jgi:hypothetical protein
VGLACNRASGLPEGFHQSSRRVGHLVAVLPPRLRHSVNGLREGRQTISGFRGQIRRSVKGLARRCSKDGEWPSQLAGESSCLCEIGGIHIAVFFSIDLDGDNAFVQQCCDFRVLKTLPGHHVTPVTRAIANRNQDWNVPTNCLGKCLFAPGIPVHFLVGVGLEIGAYSPRQTVGLAITSCHHRGGFQPSDPNPSQPWPSYLQRPAQS